MGAWKLVLTLTCVFFWSPLKCTSVLSPCFGFPIFEFRRMPRPGSARPAPPRVKRQESVEVLTTDRWGPRHRAGLGGARAERWGREGSRWCWEDLLSRKRQTRLGPDLRPHASLTFQMGERGKHVYSCMYN